MGRTHASLPFYEAPRPRFATALATHQLPPLERGRVSTVQLNLGKRCNLACLHCHVDAGPKRTETLLQPTAERVMALLDASPSVTTLDLTGGAPELNPSFRWLVREARQRGLHVIDRCNLTILLEPGMEDLADFLAEQRVHVIASLPCYSEQNVDAQRGRGTFDKSIAALQRLNALGFGHAGSALQLDLVYNPLGASLPPPQAPLEASYKERLRADHGVELHRLLTLTNMPLARFAHALEREGRFEAYMELLGTHFNPHTVPELMCRSLVSVAYDGMLYDCDFHQMAEIPFGAAVGGRSIFDVSSFEPLEGQPIATADHCLGCTAGSGSSCGGALQ